jgi:hypothetical protein
MFRYVKQIYALLGGKPRKVVYIGSTQNVKIRVRDHWRQRNSTYRTPVKDWLATLTEPPEYYVFEEVEDNVRYEAEQYYAEMIRAMGIELLNQRDGWKMRPEACSKISNTTSGRPPNSIGNTKLTEQEVREIFFSREKNDELAQTYGVSKRTIQGIRNSKTWTHLKY